MADVSQDQGGTPSRRPVLRPFTGRPLSAGPGGLRPLGARRPAVSPFASSAAPAPVDEVTPSQRSATPPLSGDGEASAAVDTAAATAAETTHVLLVESPAEPASDAEPVEAIGSVGESVAEAPVSDAFAGALASDLAGDLALGDFGAATEDDGYPSTDLPPALGDSALKASALDVSAFEDTSLGNCELVTFDAPSDDQSENAGHVDGFAAADVAFHASSAGDVECLDPAVEVDAPRAMVGGFSEFVVDDSAYAATDDDLSYAFAPRDESLDDSTPSEASGRGGTLDVEAASEAQEAMHAAYVPPALLSLSEDVVGFPGDAPLPTAAVPEVSADVEVAGAVALSGAGQVAWNTAEALTSTVDATAVAAGLPGAESDSGVREARSHAAATLEMVAERVRRGEIVSSPDANASPESVLASVLAFLLSART